MRVCPLILEYWSVLKPTFAGKVIDIVTAQADTEEGREAALKAVNRTILLIVAVILTGYVVSIGFFKLWFWYAFYNSSFMVENVFEQSVFETRTKRFCWGWMPCPHAQFSTSSFTQVLGAGRLQQWFGPTFSQQPVNVSWLDWKRTCLAISSIRQVFLF